MMNDHHVLRYAGVRDEPPTKLALYTDGHEQALHTLARDRAGTQYVCAGNPMSHSAVFHGCAPVYGGPTVCSRAKAMSLQPVAVDTKMRDLQPRLSCSE